MAKTPVLTTGLTGLVGSRIKELLQDEYEFHNMDLTTGIDITDKASIAEFVEQHPAKLMIHLAAFTNVNAAHEQTDDKGGLCYRVNVVGTQNVAEVCAEAGIHLIHFSTDFVFAGDKSEAYTEEDPRQPIEWYGQTKAMSEEVVEKTLAAYTIVRIGYPFRAKFEAKPDVVAKIRQGLEDDSLYPQFSDMTITPTYIDDIADCMRVILEKKPTGIFHLNGSASLSPYQIAQKVASAFGFDPQIVKEGSLAEYLKTVNRPYQQHLKISNQKAQAELGIKIKTFDEALADLKSQLD